MTEQGGGQTPESVEQQLEDLEVLYWMEVAP